MKQYTATTNDDGVRLSRFVQSVTRDFPTSLLYKSFRNKRVKVNGKKAARAEGCAQKAAEAAQSHRDL